MSYLLFFAERFAAIVRLATRTVTVAEFVDERSAARLRPLAEVDPPALFRAETTRRKSTNDRRKSSFIVAEAAV